MSSATKPDHSKTQPSDLPLSKSTTALTASVVVHIGRKKITVQGKPVSETPTEYWSHGGWQPPADPFLKHGLSMQHQSLALGADQELPFSLLSEILYEAEQSGFRVTSLVIRRMDGMLGSIGISIADPGSRAQPHRLQLVVAISYAGYFVASNSGGVLDNPDGTWPTIKCGSQLEQHRCPVFLVRRTGRSGGPFSMVERRSARRFWVDKYDYDRLAKLATELKQKYPSERQVVLTADRWIPYKVVIDTIDALRGKHAKCLEHVKDATGQTTDVCRKDMCEVKFGCLFDQVMLVAGVR